MARETIQDFLKAVDEHVYPQYDLFIRKFEYANAFKHVNFTEACVDFKKLSKPYCANIKQIFKKGLDYLKIYGEGGIENLPLEQRPYVKCLVDFLENKDKHLKCLAPFMGVEKELPNNIKGPVYTFLLAEHLFGPLVPGQKYNLDRNHFPNGIDTCPGGCGASIDNHLKRATGMGNEYVWHGFADIWIDNKVPVVVVTEEEKTSDESDSPSDDDDDDDDDVIIEVKQPRDKLTVPDTVSQTVAQTIVNSFLQSKNGLVPTLGASFGYIMIYMYDCENDIFLMSSTDSPLKLFSHSTKSFIDDHVIYLWMMLNYSVCERRPTDKFIEFCKKNNLSSSFPEIVKEKIHFYRNNLKKNSDSFTCIKEENEVEITPHRIHYD